MTPECRHIRTSGGKCGSYAMIGQPYCYFHVRQRERASQQMPTALSLAFTSLEDRGAIQHAICEVSIALVEHRIDSKQASSLLYALQIASSNLKEAEEIVCSESVTEVTRTEHGEELALEGAMNRQPEQEDTLADILLRDMVRRSPDYYEPYVRGQPLTVKKNKEPDQKPQGKGEPSPAEQMAAAEQAPAVYPGEQTYQGEQTQGAPMPEEQMPGDQTPARETASAHVDAELKNTERDSEEDDIPELLSQWPLDEFGHPKPLVPLF